MYVLVLGRQVANLLAQAAAAHSVLRLSLISSCEHVLYGVEHQLVLRVQSVGYV